MPLPDKELFEFDGYRLDPAECLLLRDGEPVPLEPKVFATLLVLLRHGGRLVGKEELMQAVWPDSFVEESNLTRNISVLRKALHRDDGPLYIETVPKRGYRFVGAVRARTGEQTELIVQSAKVSVVIEEEESDGETKGQGDRATRRTGEMMSGQESVAALELQQQSLGRIKRHQLGVALTLAPVAAAVAVYFIFFGGRERAPAKIDSLAVLPFVNVGANPDTEYLSDGVTDGLINGLSRLPELKVMSRNSVIRYKRRETDAQQVGNTLGVRAVLTGKVTQRGDDLLISVALVDVRDNSHVWGEQYNRKLSGLLAVQAELARDIAQQLRLKLGSEEQQRLTKRGTENPEAYELYLKGRHHLNALTEDGDRKAVAYLQQALAKDPNYGAAYAGLADYYASATYIQSPSALSPKEARAQAKEAAARAVQLDDTLADAHTALGKIAMLQEWDWPTAEREFQRALALNPNDLNARHWYSHYLVYLGRFAESLVESQRALALDPYDVSLNFHLGFHYLHARQYEQAVAQLLKALELDRNHGDTHSLLGLAYEQQGRYREAIAELQKSKELGGLDQAGMIGHVYAVSGQRGEAEKILAQLLEETKYKHVSPYNIAKIYVGLGEQEQAFAWLEKAYSERDSNLTNLKVDPQFDRLRADPRFADLLRRLGLAQ